MRWLVQIGGASLQPNNYCNFWKCGEEAGAVCNITRMKGKWMAVAAGGVLAGLNKGQSHQLLSISLEAAGRPVFYFFDLTQA